MNSSAPIKLSDPSETLPFDQGSQNAFIGFCITNKQAFFEHGLSVQSTWLVEQGIWAVMGTYRKYYDTYHTLPIDNDEFRNYAQTQVQQGDYNKFKVDLLRCTTATATHSWPFLADQVSQWRKSIIFQANITSSVLAYNAKSIQKAESIIHETSRSLIEVGRRSNMTDITSIVSMLASRHADVAGALTFGLNSLDKLLLPQGDGTGCLLPGDTTVIAAPLNTGKSTVMMTVARANVLKKKAVLWVTRESQTVDYMGRFFQGVMGLDEPALDRLSMTDKGVEELTRLGTWVSKYLTHIHVTDGSALIEDLVLDILRLQAIRKAKYGAGYDLVLVDYPSLFKNREFTRDQKYIQEEYKYRELAQLAVQERFHMLLAAQINREGAKINSGKGAMRLLDTQDIAGAFGIGMLATNVITLNISPALKKARVLVFYICKSRSSETGWAVHARNDMRVGVTHSNSLGSYYTQSNMPQEEQIDTLLKQCDGGQVDDKVKADLGLKEKRIAMGRGTPGTATEESDDLFE